MLVSPPAHCNVDGGERDDSIDDDDEKERKFDVQFLIDLIKFAIVGNPVISKRGE